MSLPDSDDPDKIPQGVVSVPIGTEVLMDIKEDLGGLKADVRTLVEKVPDIERRLGKIETALAEETPTHKHLSDRVVALETTTKQQGDSIAKLIAGSALLLTLLSNLLPTTWRDAIASVVGN